MPSLYKKYKSYIPAQQTPHWICLNSQKLGAKGMKDAELAMAGYRLFRKVHVDKRNVGWSSHSIRGCCPISATLGTRHSTKWRAILQHRLAKLPTYPDIQSSSPKTKFSALRVFPYATDESLRWLPSFRFGWSSRLGFTLVLLSKFVSKWLDWDQNSLVFQHVREPTHHRSDDPITPRCRA